MEKLLYVNHKRQQCGVYEFGKNIGTALTESTKYLLRYCECDLRYCECDSFDELKTEFEQRLLLPARYLGQTPQRAYQKMRAVCRMWATSLA
jgi:hypothetical protein